MKKWAHELNKTFSEEEVQMAKIDMKKWSTSLIIKEMPIKNILRFHLTLFRMSVIKHTNHKCLWECKLAQPLWKAMELPYDSAIPLLRICLKECKSG
jgi:hypothetical protein